MTKTTGPRELRRGVILAVMVLAGILPVWGRGLNIAIVTSRDIAPYRAARHGFVEILEQAGVSFQLHDYSTETERRSRKTVVQALRAKRPDLILTIGSAATRAVGTEIHDIPIIFSLVLEDLTTAQEGESAKLGRNVTGASMYIPLKMQFEKLREAIPTARRFGVLFNPEETGTTVEQAGAVAAGMDLELVKVPVRSQAEVLDKLRELEGKVDLLWSVADSTVFTSQSVRFILLNTLRYRIPFIGLSPSYVRAGALLSLSCDYEDVGRQAGEAALQVLQGSAPESVPITVPRTVSIYLNMNTAKQLEVDISARVRETAELVSGS